MVSTEKKKMFNANEFFSKFKRGKRGQSVSTKTGGGGVRAFMSKLSGAFLLPISVLSIAGLFLGVGATIAGNAPAGAGRDFGDFVKQLGDPIFGVLPLLFAVAITISFTEEAGVAVFNAVIAYAVFSGIQSVFIKEIRNSNGALLGYNVLFGGPGREKGDLLGLVGKSIGINSLQTSVFGGIIIGFVVQWAYHKFHTTKLPQWLAFYSGKRFVAFPVIGLMIPTAFAFLLLWPYVGFVFNWIGRNSGKVGFGIDSFIFGFIERSLVPFGLHHVFYSPLWYTAAGADVAALVNDFIKAGNTINHDDLTQLSNVLKGELNLVDGVWQINGALVLGDSTTSLALLGYNKNDITFTKEGKEYSKPLLMFIQDELGLKIGRFLQGKFSFMQWGLPAAGAAMVMAAPKENRRVATGVVFPAALTCFVTGVTEPIEFTFLFLAPLMFFGFHAFMCALSFMLANIMNVHIAQSFSGGFLDLVLYGMVPVLKGTNFWWVIVVGLAYAPIYYFVFFFWIKKADLATPGRGGNVKLFTKKDYLASKDAAAGADAESGADPQTMAVIEAFGGADNIVTTANCASRLRFDVKDANLVDVDKMKAHGAFGVQKTSATHVQVIFGPVSETLKTKIDKALKNKKA